MREGFEDGSAFSGGPWRESRGAGLTHPMAEAGDYASPAGVKTLRDSGQSAILARTVIGCQTHAKIRVWPNAQVRTIKLAAHPIPDFGQAPAPEY